MTKTRARHAPKQKSASTATTVAQEAELVEMDGAIKLLKTTRPTFYRWLREGRIKGLKVGRQWRFRKEDIERFLRGEGPRVELHADIRPLFDQFNERLVKLGAEPATFARGADEVGQVANAMAQLGVKMRASDLHLESLNLDGKQVGLVRLRIDGALYKVAEFDHRLLVPLTDHWKGMAKCNVNVRRMTQDGRILLDVEGRQLDLRFNFFPGALGENMTMRLLDPRLTHSLDFEKWGLAPEALEKLRAALNCPYGLIVVSGPTGTGKTSMLYACINKLSGEKRKIISIEDPVEYILPWVEQIPVKVNEGLTFHAALRAALRSAADVLMVGEIRDAEILGVSIEAVFTGHLLLTTLHTPDAATGLARLVRMCGEPFLVADACRLMVAQRLVRQNCRECSAEEPVQDQARLQQVLDEARKGGLVLDGLPGKLQRGKGCKACNFTGYHGRMLVTEMLAMSPEIGGALLRGAPVPEVRALAISQGMKTLVADAVRRLLAGETSLDEVVSLSRSMSMAE
ncbi:MAG: ATPase, T2SS/T4P/T4SS family [Planctomycetota bacterium]